MSGNAAIMAAKDLRQKIFEYAERIFPKEMVRQLKKYREKHPDYKPPDFDIENEVKGDNFDLKEGYVFLKNAPKEPWMRLELGRLIRAIHLRQQGTMLNTEVFYDPPSDLPNWETGKGNMSATYVYGTQGAEVEVDTDTGEVKILRLVAAHDVGKVLNLQGLKGQIYGALAQGLGYTFYEKIKTQDGKILNPNFRDYKIPTIHEMDFPIDLEFVETDDKFGPFGAKGVAESGLVPTAPAIANAIYNAVGVRIRDLPITPEKILDALNKKEKKAKKT